MISDCVVITIDGPAGSGKSTLAEGLARAFGIACLDTGATYRAVAYRALFEGIDPADENSAIKIAESVHIQFQPPTSDHAPARVIVNGQDVTGQLRTNDVSTTASIISAHPKVREIMVKMQRTMAAELCAEQESNTSGNRLFKGVVLEGRDTGTVVFPDASIKFYLKASLDERSKRRLPDFKSGHRSFINAKAEVLSRDIRDMKRAVAPLKPAKDAVHIDNTNWVKEETLAYAVDIVNEFLSLK